MRRPLTQADIDRFWTKVDKSGDCWLWTASRNRHGYGYFGIGRRCFLAHRISLEIATGAPVPAGVLACHSCDNPPCVRPDHLYPGTNKDNTDDMFARGRARPARGLRNGLAKLSDRDVEVIRARVAAGESRKSVARDLKLDSGYVGRIVAGVRR